MKPSRINVSIEQWMGLSIGLLLASVSATADWYTYYSINPGVGFMVLGVAIVAALVMVKILGAAFLIHTHGRRRLALLVLLAVLIGLSGATGTFFFKSLLDGESSETVRKSYQYQEIQESINVLKRQQAAITQQLAACPSGWKSNCINPLQKDISKLETNKNKLLKKLKALPADSSTMEFWQGISIAIGWNVNQVHWLVFGFISILIDLLSLAGFAIFGSSIPPLFFMKKVRPNQLQEKTTAKNPHVAATTNKQKKWSKPAQLIKPFVIHHKKMQ
ncbi:MAG: hypothetical protein Q9N68_05640 [Gammaproteobacteria bacterium]|nr:hypothetical protein [Gammaproteobacteria bacterium]